MSYDPILADEPSHTTNNFDALGNLPTPAYTLAEARRLFALGLEVGPTPLTDLDRSLGLRDGDLDLDPPDDFPVVGRIAAVGLMDFLLAEANAAYWRDRTPGERASAEYRRAMDEAEGG